MRYGVTFCGVARELLRLAILHQLARLPRRRLPGRNPVLQEPACRARAVLDQTQPALGLEHTEAGSAAIKVGRIVAPQVAALAQKVLRLRADLAQLCEHLDGERVAGGVVHARCAQPAPLEQVLRVEP